MPFAHRIASKRANMNLVLDTNVIFSAILWRGTAHRFLLSASEQPDAHLFSSMPLVLELEEVLNRPESVTRLSLLNISADKVLADYLMTVTLVDPADITATCRDADDDAVLACALAAKADMIVTGDKDLLVLHPFQNIAILSPADALQQLTQNH